MDVVKALRTFNLRVKYLCYFKNRQLNIFNELEECIEVAVFPGP